MQLSSCAAVLLAAAATTMTTALVMPPLTTTTATQLQRQGTTTLRMSWQPNEEYNAWGSKNTLTDFERAARDAGATDRKVTIRKPLGLVLGENSNKDVYIKEVVKGGNADAMDVKEGDLIAMCSATFGTEMWSTRGVGLSRVMRAIEVRSGQTVSLVVQSKSQQRDFLKGLFGSSEKAKQARIDEATTKRQRLEDEIKEERKEAAKGWFGLF